jgi:SAM-dependent methyltransferase
MEPVIESDIYRIRFSDDELAQQRKIWKPICSYLQKWIPASGTTLDLGAGYCHFINTIESKQKIAVDINDENLRKYARPEVRCIPCSGANMSGVSAASVDAVFASNVYEHFPSLEDVSDSFRDVYRVLKPGGRFIILQPNFRFCMKEYFDFFDHRLLFTHRGMVEGLEISHFDIEKVIACFLPYTSKSSLPKVAWLVSLYLKVPLVWRILGGQMLLVARKPVGV